MFFSQVMKNLFTTLYRYPYFKALWDSRFPHFVFVGVVNTSFSYIIFALLIYLRLNYMLAVLISTCIGIIFNFKTTGKVVFKNNQRRLIIPFIAVYGVSYFINIMLIKFFYIVYPSYYFSGAAAIIIMPFLNFFALKIFVFRKNLLKDI